MWDSAASLNRLTDLLLFAAAGLALYGALHYAVRLPWFGLREIRIVQPVEHVTRAEIEEVVQRHVRGTFFTLNLERTRAAFETLPWVRSANLRRQWPDRLEVALEEHVPLARWEGAGLVSTQGEVFKAAYDGFLPVFAGPPGTAKEITIQYEYFRASLATVGRVPLRIQVSPRRAWQLRLDEDTVIELGREHMEARLARFVAVYPRAVLPLNRPIRYVDLRYTNGFAVRIPELQLPQPTKKSTNKS